MATGNEPENIPYGNDNEPEQSSSSTDPSESCILQSQPTIVRGQCSSGSSNSMIDHEESDTAPAGEDEVLVKDVEQKPKTSVRFRRTAKEFEREREEIINGKFDFGDRDRKPRYNVTLPLLKETEGKEWAIEELKILHDCINSYGVSDNCLFYATKNITMRSMLEIREKIAEIRELTRLRQKMRAETRKAEWLRDVMPPSKTSQIQNWSSALSVIQSKKRRISDYTDSALVEYFGHEIRCRPLSQTTKKYVRLSDSLCAPKASKREVIDYADYYRFLQSCVPGGTTKFECKPFVAAVILNILDEIEKEVDDPKHEKRRRILAGMFRDIQGGDLSDYDFRDAVDTNDILSVQLNPLSLMRDMLETREQW